MLDIIMKIYEGIFKTKTSQIAFTAFTISLLFTFVIFFLLTIGPVIVQGGKLSGAFGTLSETARVILAMMFIIVFIAMWYILYLQYVREAEDVFSRLREKLLGGWVAEYDYILPGPQTIIAKQKTLFKITLNNDRKLQFVFDSHDDEIFADKDNIVSDIALRHIQSGKYKMIFHYAGERSLKSTISFYLDAYPGQDAAILQVETIAILDFDDPPNPHQVVTSMTGEWYDLNGSLKRLGVLINRIDTARRENKTFKTKLWELDPEVKNIGAKMGTVAFSRMITE